MVYQAHILTSEEKQHLRVLYLEMKALLIAPILVISVTFFLLFIFSFNQLDLPAYETYDKLRRMLLLACTECSEGFGLAQMTTFRLGSKKQLNSQVHRFQTFIHSPGQLGSTGLFQQKMAHNAVMWLYNYFHEKWLKCVYSHL